MNLAIYIITTILVIFICIAGHRLSKINVSAAQSDKQTIQAHAFLRKDIIREKVKTHIKGGNKKERHNESITEGNQTKKITESHNPRLRHSKKKEEDPQFHSDKWTE